MEHADLITHLYASLEKGDGEAMAACYAPNARFNDPAFGELTGDRIGGMWRMLCAAGSGVSVELSDVVASNDTGSAHWVASYNFSSTGRDVVNRIDAKYRFADGLIVDHVDTFSFHTWARQALGPVGLALGWAPFFQAKARARANAQLDRFLTKAR